MDIKAIKNEQDYAFALSEIGRLMNAEPGSADENRLEVLAILVEKYEEEVFQIDLPDAVSAIKFRMEQEGLMPLALLNKYTDELINTTNKALWQVEHVLTVLNEMEALAGEEAVKKVSRKFKLVAWRLLNITFDICEIQKEASLEFGELGE